MVADEEVQEGVQVDEEDLVVEIQEEEEVVEVSFFHHKFVNWKQNIINKCNEIKPNQIIHN